MISYLNPLVNLVHAWHDSKASSQELVALKQENVSLRQQVNLAQSPQTMEREARKMGMVKAGERLHVVRGLDD